MTPHIRFMLNPEQNAALLRDLAELDAMEAEPEEEEDCYYCLEEPCSCWDEGEEVD